MGKKGKRTERLNESKALKKKEDARRDDIAAKLDRLALSLKNDKVCDTDLFAPPPPRPECPICMLTMPLGSAVRLFMSCCGKVICCACHAEQVQVCKETNRKNASLRRPLKDLTCAFCRDPAPSKTEAILSAMNRADNNDPIALHNLACRLFEGRDGFPKNELKALELFHQAAELGSMEACTAIAIHYGDVAKDKGKKRIFLEIAARNGNVVARRSLGVLEYNSNQRELSMRHFRLSAAVGCEGSLDVLKEDYKEGGLSKDELASVLRAFQTSQDEMKSEARDRWAENAAKDD